MTDYASRTNRVTKRERNLLTRRSFIEATFVGSIPLVVSSITNPQSPVAKQSHCSSRQREWDHRGLSNTILNHVGSEFARIYNTIQDRGSVRAEEIRTVALNMELLFGHFQETGLNSALVRQMHACQQELLDFMPQEEHIRAIQNKLASFGIAIGKEWLLERLSLAHDKRLWAISQIEARGIHGFANPTIAALRRMAKRLEKQESNSVGAPVALEDEMEDDDQGIRQEMGRVLEQAEAALLLLAAILVIVGLAEAAALVVLLVALINFVQSLLC